MPIPLATNFKNNSNLPLDADTVFDSMGDLLVSEWRKEGVPVYLKDEQQYYYWNGVEYVEQSAGMPEAPIGAIYGASGKNWHVLENVERRFVILNHEEIPITEVNNVITISPEELASKDNFTVIHQGAKVVFYKSHPTITELSSTGTDKKLYQFVMNWSAGTVTITELLDLNNVQGGTAVYAAYPDTANAEKFTNLITAMDDAGNNNLVPGTYWTADRDGFVVVSRWLTAPTDQVDSAYFRVNGVIVTDWTPVITYDVLPVSIGDVVKCEGYTPGGVDNIECFFIPPKYINIPAGAVG